MTVRDTTSLIDADRLMEERANRAKELLSTRYSGMRRAQERKAARKLQLEKRMIGLEESQKRTLRSVLAREEVAADKASRKRASTSDFESLAVIGRGAFGEVRLVRRRPGAVFGGGKKNGGRTIYALKSMEKKMMVRKNQVHHIKAEREVLSMADDSYPWLTHLHASFQDETTLYMVLEFMPGGDLMGLLIREDTFSEDVTKFFMAEAALAIGAVHALGYVHRDIKPDNMLLDKDGHLKLTDLGLCKKVGDVRPEHRPEVVLRTLNGLQQDLGAPGSPTCVASILPLCDDFPSPPSLKSSAGGGSSSGSGTQQQQSRRELMRSTVGTPDYIAPEVLAAQNGDSSHHYDSSVDWWSLGVIMYECLVGYTPFYSEDPVRTCRKILKWRETLRIPSDTRKTLSKECIDFLSCLMAEPGRRIGSTVGSSRRRSSGAASSASDSDDGTEAAAADYKTGFEQIVSHPWFDGFDWANLGKGQGPLLPRGADEFPSLLEQLATIDRSHPRFERIMERVTCNFETFEDEYDNSVPFDEQVVGRGGGRRKKVESHNLDEFYDYHYTRGRTPRVPSPETFDCLRETQVAKRMADLTV